MSAAFTLRIVTALVLLGIAPFIGLLLPYAWELKLALFAIWGSFFFSALNQIVIGVQQRHLKMHVVAVAEVAGRIVLLLGLLVAVKLGWNLLAIVTLVSLGSLANFAINAWIAARYSSLTWNWDPEFWRVLIKRAWPIGVSILFNLLYFKADTLILSLVRPLSEVGIYGAAYRVLEILVTLPFMYAGVVLPLMAKSWAAKNAVHFRNLLKHSFIAMTMLAAPMTVGAVILGRQTMILVAGRDFALSGDVLKILMLAVAIIFFGTVSSHAIVALDAQKRMMPVYIATSVVTLIGYCIFIPRYGMWAAAWLTVFSEFCVALAATLLSLRISQTAILWGPILKSVFAAIVMGLAILPVKDAWLPIPILVGAVVYTTLIVITGALSRQTVRDLLKARRGAPTAEST